MFEGVLRFPIIDNNYILSFNVYVGISIRIWIVVFWCDDNEKFFTTFQPLDFVVYMLIHWMFFTSVSEIDYNIYETQWKI